ncbi:MAG: TIGR02452 family protein, partial [Roseburia sp.]|nr:TIGR02452 family protein [Roseburia sp.]
DMGGDYKEHVMKRMATADVITCAAPNMSAYYKYRAGAMEDYQLIETITSRIGFVLNAAIREGRSEIILGAFGCGVFGNDPEGIAYIFKHMLHGCYDGYFKMAYFPVPSGNQNFPAFRKVFLDEEMENMIIEGVEEF